MKHDAAGKLLWVRYAFGKSAAYRLALDKKGIVYLAGSMQSSSLTFTSIDTTTVKLKAAIKANTGIYICKYDAAGKVVQTQFYSEGRNETVNDLFLDENDNLYLAGR